MFQLEVSSGSRLVDDQKPKGGRREASTSDHLSQKRSSQTQNIYNAATNNSTTIRSQLTQHSQLHKTTFKRTEDIEVFKLNFGWNIRISLFFERPK